MEVLFVSSLQDFFEIKNPGFPVYVMMSHQTTFSQGVPEVRATIHLQSQWQLDVVVYLMEQATWIVDHQGKAVFKNDVETRQAIQEKYTNLIHKLVEAGCTVVKGLYGIDQNIRALPGKIDLSFFDDYQETRT